MEEESKVVDAINSTPQINDVPIIKAKKKVVIQNDECQFLYTLLTKINPSDLNNARIIWDAFQTIEDLVVEFEKAASKFTEKGDVIKQKYAADQSRDMADGERAMTKDEMNEQIEVLNVDLRALHATNIQFEAHEEMITVMMQLIDMLTKNPAVDLSGRNNVRMLVSAYDALQKARIS